MSRPKEFIPDEAIEKALQVFWHKGYEGNGPQSWLALRHFRR
jgi:hypothetical protein